MRIAAITTLGLVLLVSTLFLYFNSKTPPNPKESTVYDSTLLKSSYRISYERSALLGFGGSRLVVTSSPSGAKVELDGQEKPGETPLIIDDVNAGQHTLVLMAEGYESAEVPVGVVDGFMSRVEVNLLFSPLANLAEVEVEQLNATNLLGGDLVINSRASWASDPPRLDEEQIKTAPWEKIHVFGVDVPLTVSATPELLASLDQLARDKENLPALPFAYLVDETGAVYEGLGVYHFDYSSLNSTELGASFNAQEAPVLVLNTAGEVLNDAVKQALVALREELGQPARFEAKLITVLDEVVLQTQEQRQLALEFVNIGNAVWRQGEVRLMVEPGERASEFYTANDWLSTSEVAAPEKSTVLPGETSRFTFTITAPPYPDKFTEQLRLLDQTVELKLKVEGEAGTVVQITDTPTGFLNVREGPGTSHTLKGVVYPGEKYLVLEEAPSWYKLRLRDGSEGWVIGTYVRRL